MAARPSTTPYSVQSTLVPTGMAIVTVAGALILLTVPLPAWLVDLLLAVNLAGATGLLLVALLTPRPVELSTLPSIVVLSSLARLLLALGVARLVVTIGHAGPLTMTLAAVAGFHKPVVSLGSLLILAVVQIVVVTAGVTRIAEVAARFALDALPGKQLALETKARTRGQNDAEAEDTVAYLEREANFYGAMDGAARFLRGETIAVLAIVILTPLVRLASAGMTANSWETLALTVAGHGLIILVPALLVGAAAAILVARASATSDLTAEAGRQFFGSPTVVLAVALACLLLALVPGVAKVPLLAVAAVLGVWGWFIARRASQSPVTTAPQAEQLAQSAISVAPGPQLHLGWGLLGLLNNGGELVLTQLGQLRAQLSEQLGFGLPPFVVRDSEKLEIDEYALMLRGSILGSGRLRLARRLAVADQPAELPDEGVSVELPDGRYGKWINVDSTEPISGTTTKLLEPSQVLLEHLRWLIRKNAGEFFDTERASELIEQLAHSHRATVAEARAAGLSAPSLAGVGRELLAKGIPLRDWVALAETLTAGLSKGASPAQLVDMARQAMAPAITQTVAPDGTGYAIILAPEVEQELLTAARGQPRSAPLALAPDDAERWRNLLAAIVADQQRGERPLVLLCDTQVRPGLAQLAASLVPALIVLDPDELARDTQIENVHTIVSEELAEAMP